MPDYCRCGCGEYSNSEFLRGHALRYAASLRRRHGHGDRQATRQLYERGWNITGSTHRPETSPQAFGFEAEFFGMTQYHAVDTLNDYGIDTQDDGYHHQARPYWRVTEDGSVSQEGCELVSPILRLSQKEAIFTSRMAVRALAEAGGVVNRSCGLHVHHNLRGKTVGDVAETVAHWALLQPVINKILPASRASASYAVAMNDPRSWYNGIGRHTLDPTENAVDGLRGPSSRGLWGRYHSINLEAIAAHGTLEYRQHSGTLNGDKLEHWIKLTRAFHDVRRIGTWEMLVNLYGTIGAVGSMSVEDMCRYLKLPKATRDFYVRREQQLTVIGDDEGADEGNEDGEEPEHDDGDTDEYGEGQYCNECGRFHYEGDDEYNEEG